MFFRSNRINSHHFGFDGSPLKELDYRVLFSYVQNWGTYDSPFQHISKTYSAIVELKYKPTQLEGWSFALTGALDRSKWIGNNNGFEITIEKKFKIK